MAGSTPDSTGSSACWEEEGLLGPMRLESRPLQCARREMAVVRASGRWLEADLLPEDVYGSRSGWGGTRESKQA